MAIHKTIQRKGYGSALLIDALRRAHDMSKSVAATGVIVDAKDESSKAFYRKHEFIALIDDPMRLYVPMGTIAQLVK